MKKIIKYTFLPMLIFLSVFIFIGCGNSNFKHKPISFKSGGTVFGTLEIVEIKNDDTSRPPVLDYVGQRIYGFQVKIKIVNELNGTFKFGKHDFDLVLKDTTIYKITMFENNYSEDLLSFSSPANSTKFIYLMADITKNTPVESYIVKYNGQRF